MSDLAQISEQFGVEVRAILKAKEWSFRRATIATGIDYGTIGNMAMGMVPRKGAVIDWATNTDGRVNYWLELAGYDRIPPELVGAKDADQRVREEEEEPFRPIGDPMKRRVTQYLLDHQHMTPAEIQEMWDRCGPDEDTLTKEEDATTERGIDDSPLQSDTDNQRQEDIAHS